MNIALLSGAFPPDLDGIGDYTWWLSKTLVEQGHAVTVFTSRGPEREPAPGVDVHPFFDPLDSRTLAPLPKLLEGGGFDWLIVQYNPFSFGKRGYCPGLIKALNTMKRRSGCPKIAIMFHETMVPRWPWRFAVMRMWQYRQFKQLCRLCDQAFASTERYLKQVKLIGSAVPAKQLAVGSNVPTSKLSKAKARKRLDIPEEAIVLGVFGSAHMSRLIDWIGRAVRAAYEADNRVKVLYVGADGGKFEPQFPKMPFRDMGALPMDEVSASLRAMDLLIAPFIDGASTRRGSLIAGLMNGITVLSTRTDWTEAVLDDIPGLYLTDVDAGPKIFSDRAVEFVQQANKGRFLDPPSSFSWESISYDLLNTLKGSET